MHDCVVMRAEHGLSTAAKLTAVLLIEAHPEWLL
jgi:hypothetical protein